MNNINNTNLLHISMPYENNDINNVLANSNDYVAEEFTIVKRSVIKKENNKLGFNFFRALCKNKDTISAAKILTEITASYTYSQYIDWLVNGRIPSIYSTNKPVAIRYSIRNATGSPSYSPLGYAIKEKKFNIIQNLITIAGLKQQKHDPHNLIIFLQQKYLEIISNNHTSEKKIELEKAMLSLTKTYLNTTMSICDLVRLVDFDDFEEDEDFSTQILDSIIETKVANGCWNEIKQFFQYIISHKTQYSNAANSMLKKIFLEAIEYDKPEFVIMVLREDQTLLTINEDDCLIYICIADNYTLMKQCLAYINFESKDFLVCNEGHRFLYGKHMLNYCITEHFNEAALAIITHGINISCTQHILKEKFSITNSQTALLTAIQANNYKIIQILIGLNAKQCETNEILNSEFFDKPIENEQIKDILNNPLSLQIMLSIKFASNLLKKMNNNLDASLEDIKEYIKQNNLLPTAYVNGMKSIEDIFLLDYAT